MSVRFREVMTDGTPRRILRALRDTRQAPDHEDLWLLLKNVLYLLDEMADDLQALKEAPKEAETP